MPEHTDYFVSSLGPLDKHEVLDDEWPLHVKLLRFTLPEHQESRFSVFLTNHLHRIRPITISGDDLVEIGEGESKRIARLVAPIGALSLLHDSLRSLVERFDGQTTDDIEFDRVYLPNEISDDTPVEKKFEHCDRRTLANLQRVRDFGDKALVISSLPFMKNGGMI